MKKPIGIVLFLLSWSITAQSQDIREDFNNLQNWEPLIFPKIELQSEYKLVNEEDNSILEARSSGGASGLTYKEEFDIYLNPVMSWRWKISEVLKEGDARKKSGDDYPIRIYVIFEYDPDKSKGLQGVQYELAKLIYGEYPPDSALNYVWANKQWQKDYLPNAYTDHAVMIGSDAGSTYQNQWREHKINILEDYRRIFKKDPPRMASLAIMTDSDDTGESTLAYLDYITLEKE